MMNQLSIQVAAAEPVPIEAESHQYLTFGVADERYAIDILDINEIIEVGRMTRVPMAPPHVRGVINLRGSVVPLVDLSARLGKGASEITKRSSIVLARVEAKGEQQSLGMLVDEVNEILEIPSTHLRPAPEFGTEIHPEFIEAMARVGDAFMILLDVRHVLSVDELAQLQGLENSAAAGGLVEAG